MPITDEMFRFVSTRPPDTLLRLRIESKLIHDRRPFAPLLHALFAPGDFEPKLRTANAVAASADFLASDDPAMLALEPVIVFLRRELQTGRALDELAEEFADGFPVLAPLLAAAPPRDLLEQTAAFLGRLWDCLYAQVIRGCDRFVSTNHLIDALRVYHVLLLLWLSAKIRLEQWRGGDFDAYEPIIDLDAAAEPGRIGRAMKTKTRSPRIAAAGAGLASFRVPLTVGAIKPPIIGDLHLVEQDLLGYKPGELAQIATIMRGERRETSTRTLSRTTQTTTTESLTEQEETSSVTAEERFSMTVQAQETAAQSFGVQVGVSVTGKFGPVQVGATANASYDTSESSTESTAQEFAKTVTEEATKRVKTSFKETTSITLLTETQTTALQSFNNESGTAHVNGLYCWIDKEYDARLMNYGRRLMWTPTVPEPAAFYRGLLQQRKAKLTSDLDEPLHPSLIDRVTLEPLSPADTDSGFRSFEDVTEDNYALLAGLYDVTNVSPAPEENITGGKPVAVPSGMQPVEMNDEGLSLVTADTGLTTDAGYRFTSFGVFAPDGPLNNFRQLADSWHMGEKKDVTDRIQVMVGHKEFYFSATGQGGNDPKLIDTNFNEMISIIQHDGTMFGELVRPSVPITITASFSGMLSINIVYSAVLTPEALDQWKAATFATILKGYAAKKQAYDQAVSLVKAQVQSETQAQTFSLREDQYRAIELTELKRGSLELLTEGTATGHTSIAVSEDGVPTIIHHEADATGLTDWRAPLANGTVAEFFELALDWSQTTYEFLPYYWAGAERWAETAQAAAADPVFEGFLRAGSATVVVPVRPGYERPFLFFLKTGLLWGGRHMPLFTDEDMLNVYADVELATQLDPPVQVGPSWQFRLPTSMVMLQEGDELPRFPPVEPQPGPDEPPEPIPDDTAPF